MRTVTVIEPLLSRIECMDSAQHDIPEETFFLSQPHTQLNLTTTQVGLLSSLLPSTVATLSLHTYQINSSLVASHQRAFPGRYVHDPNQSKSFKFAWKGSNDTEPHHPRSWTSPTCNSILCYEGMWNEPASYWHRGSYPFRETSTGRNGWRNFYWKERMPLI